MFGYEHIDESIQSVEMQYRLNLLNTMIDGIILDDLGSFMIPII